MKKILLCSLGIFQLIFLSVNAYPSIVFDQSPPHSTSGGLMSSINPDVHVYDNFTLDPTTYTNDGITGINWWGFYTPTYSGSSTFTLTFYADNNGSPDLGSGVEVSYSSLSVTPLYSDGGVYLYSLYSASLSNPFPATANTEYWLSIYNTSPSRWWGWQRSDPYGDGSIQTPPIPGSIPSNVAFQLTSTDPVPIPSAAWLLALGLIGLAVVRRRIIRK